MAPGRSVRWRPPASGSEQPRRCLSEVRRGTGWPRFRSGDSRLGTYIRVEGLQLSTAAQLRKEVWRRAHRIRSQQQELGSSAERLLRRHRWRGVPRPIPSRRRFVRRDRRQLMRWRGPSQRRAQMPEDSVAWQRTVRSHARFLGCLEATSRPVDGLHLRLGLVLRCQCFALRCQLL